MNRARRKQSDYSRTSGIFNDIYHTELFQSDILTNFTREDCEEDSYILTTDITTLLRIDKLNELTKNELISYFNNLSKTSSTFDAITDKLTDKQLISLVKSRYIQSPSELQAWASYLASNYKNLEVQKQMDSMQENATIIQDNETKA
jgi:hypothetical protein